MMELANATHLNLVNKIDDKTGASVGMWRDVNAAPAEWARYFRQAAPVACLHAGCHPGSCLYGPA